MMTGRETRRTCRDGASSSAEPLLAAPSAASSSVAAPSVADPDAAVMRRLEILIDDMYNTTERGKKINNGYIHEILRAFFMVTFEGSSTDIADSLRRYREILQEKNMAVAWEKATDFCDDCFGENLGGPRSDKDVREKVRDIILNQLELDWLLNGCADRVNAGIEIEKADIKAVLKTIPKMSDKEVNGFLGRYQEILREAQTGEGAENVIVAIHALIGQLRGLEADDRALTILKKQVDSCIIERYCRDFDENKLAKEDKIKVLLKLIPGASAEELYSSFDQIVQNENTEAAKRDANNFNTVLTRLGADERVREIIIAQLNLNLCLNERYNIEGAGMCLEDFWKMIPGMPAEKVFEFFGRYQDILEGAQTDAGAKDVIDAIYELIGELRELEAADRALTILKKQVVSCVIERYCRGFDENKLAKEDEIKTLLKLIPGDFVEKLYSDFGQIVQNEDTEAARRDAYNFNTVLRGLGADKRVRQIIETQLNLNLCLNKSYNIEGAGMCLKDLLDMIPGMTSEKIGEYDSRYKEIMEELDLQAAEEQAGKFIEDLQKLGANKRVIGIFKEQFESCYKLIGWFNASQSPYINTFLNKGFLLNDDDVKTLLRKIPGITANEGDRFFRRYEKIISANERSRSVYVNIEKFIWDLLKLGADRKVRFILFRHMVEKIDHRLGYNKVGERKQRELSDFLRNRSFLYDRDLLFLSKNEFENRGKKSPKTTASSTKSSSSTERTPLLGSQEQQAEQREKLLAECLDATKNGILLDPERMWKVKKELPKSLRNSFERCYFGMILEDIYFSNRWWWQQGSIAKFKKEMENAAVDLRIRRILFGQIDIKLRLAREISQTSEVSWCNLLRVKNMLKMIPQSESFGEVPQGGASSSAMLSRGEPGPSADAEQEEVSQPSSSTEGSQSLFDRFKEIWLTENTDEYMEKAKAFFSELESLKVNRDVLVAIEQAFEAGREDEFRKRAAVERKAEEEEKRKAEEERKAREREEREAREREEKEAREREAEEDSVSGIDGNVDMNLCYGLRKMSF